MVMSSDQISLKDALCFVVDNRGKTAPTAEQGHALIATNCISNDDLYPTYKNVRYVSEDTFQRWFRAHPKPGDIILTNKGSQNGAICLVPKVVDFCIAQDMMALRADPERIDSLYLFAALRSAPIQQAIKNLNVDGVIPHFKKTDFNKLFIPLPDRRIQVLIGQLHFGLVEKIELNRRMNEKLKAMARALFRDWFVDFGPTRAKLAGTAPYLSADLWALFANWLDDKDKPVGWEASTIGDEVRVVGGSTPSTKEPAFWDGAINWATPKDLSNLSAPVLLETNFKITQAGLAKIGSGLLPVGTVLLSSRAPIGYLAISEVPVAINQGFIGMICEKRISNVFAWLWTLENMEAILAKANGSTFQEISKGNFRPLPVIVPPEPILQAFDALAHPLYQRIVQNERESRTLAQTRDLLLPRLMSGDVQFQPEIMAG